MAKYEPRLTAPSTTDKNWIHTSKGGYNSCIHISGGSVLPNCVGYAWGRWRELLGENPKLSRGNAEIWWRNTADGYERGSTPRVGAIICWRKGKAGVASDGAGHIAIVEQVNADGSIVTSNSEYGGNRFYLKTRKPPYHLSDKHTFQGFIYLPISFEEEEPKKTVDELAKEVLAGKWGNGADRKARLTAAGYNYSEVQSVVNAILTGKQPAQSLQPVQPVQPAPTKSIDELAREVIKGKWGNGADRKKKLTDAGYNASEIQEAVNKILKGL